MERRAPPVLRASSPGRGGARQSVEARQPLRGAPDCRRAGLQSGNPVRQVPAPREVDSGAALENPHRENWGAPDCRRAGLRQFSGPVLPVVAGPGYLSKRSSHYAARRTPVRQVPAPREVDSGAALENPHRENWGAPYCRLAGLQSGTPVRQVPAAREVDSGAALESGAPYRRCTGLQSGTSRPHVKSIAVPLWRTPTGRTGALHTAGAPDSSPAPRDAPDRRL